MCRKGERVPRDRSLGLGRTEGCKGVNLRNMNSHLLAVSQVNEEGLRKQVQLGDQHGLA